MQQYRSRVSSPLLDRIQSEVPGLRYREIGLAKKLESLRLFIQGNLNHRESFHYKDSTEANN